MSDHGDHDGEVASINYPKVNKFPLPHLAREIVDRDRAQDKRSVDLISLKYRSKSPTP